MKDVIYVIVNEKLENEKRKLYIKNYTVACLDTGDITKSLISKVKIQNLINELDYEYVGYVVVNKYAPQLKARLKDNPNIVSGKVKIFDFYEFHGIRNMKGFEVNDFVATANCIERRYFYDTDYIHSSRDLANFSMWYYNKGKYGDDILDDIVQRTLTHISAGLRDDINCLEQNKGRYNVFKNMLYLLDKSKNLVLAKEAKGLLEDNPKDNIMFCIYLKDYLIRTKDAFIPFKRISNMVPDLSDEDILKFNTLFKTDCYKTKRDFEEVTYTKELLSSLYEDYKEKQREIYQINQANGKRSYKRRLFDLIEDIQ